MVPTDAPGVVVRDDWDAPGMRASRRNSISLEGVELSESGVRGGFPAGDPLPYIDHAAARGFLSRAAALIDAHRAANPASDGGAEALGALFAEAQAAKAFVNEAAARGTPVTSTKRMALNAMRSSIRGRPIR